MRTHLICVLVTSLCAGDEEILAIEVLLVDVDGVLVDGRPGDGRHWLSSVEQDFGFTSGTLHEEFFAPHWEDVVLGRSDLIKPLTAALQRFAPGVSPSAFVSYWFNQDSRINVDLLQHLRFIRSTGVRVYLATNQEHLRAAYLMNTLGLAKDVDGIFYSARLGAKKPDAEFFSKVQAALQSPVEDLLLVDDSYQNVEAALKAGWRAVHWTENSSPDQFVYLESVPAPAVGSPIK